MNKIMKHKVHKGCHKGRRGVKNFAVFAYPSCPLRLKELLLICNLINNLI